MTDSTQDGYENAVFVSYAWGGESERTVDELEQAFAARGLRVVRDKKDLGYKGSIEAFEQRIGRGQCVVLVISDKYLRSPHCMYELLKMQDNLALRERIFPLVLADALIYTPVGRLGYRHHWDEQVAQLEQAIRQTRQLSDLDEALADLKKYISIRDNLVKLIALLGDMNALTPELHAREGYATVIEKVTRAMDGSGTASGAGTVPRASARREAGQHPEPTASQPVAQAAAPRETETPHSTTAPRLASASLTLTLSAEPNPAPANTEVTWTATARNPGAAPARNLELLWDDTYLHENEDCFDLPAGGERAFPFRRSYAEPGSYLETVRLLGGPASIEAAAQVHVFQPAGFSLRLAASLERPTPGEEVTWTLEVHNDGGQDLRQMRLRQGNKLLKEPFDLLRGEKKTLSFGRRYAQAGEAAESVQAAASTSAGERLARQADGRLLVTYPDLRLTLAPGVFLDLRRVPAGEFLMGGDPKKDSQADADEKPQHKVYLDEYFMGKYPITVAQFAAFIKATNYQSATTLDVKNKADHPVVYVSWQDAAAFCQWASKATGKPLRLPTEAEWEKAARGTDGRIYPWGDEWPDAKRCNFGNNVKDTTPVGKYSPQGDSPYGCADMAGNVCEWCSDWVAEGYYASSPRENPKGPASGEYRALRGGSWGNDGNSVRASDRLRVDPTTGYDYIGFRCAFSP